MNLPKTFLLGNVGKVPLTPEQYLEMLATVIKMGIDDSWKKELLDYITINSNIVLTKKEKKKIKNAFTLVAAIKAFGISNKIRIYLEEQR